MCYDFRNIDQKVVRKVKLRDNNNKTLVLGNRSSATYQRSRQREACQANDHVGLLCSTNQRRASLTLKGNTTWKKSFQKLREFQTQKVLRFSRYWPKGQKQLKFKQQQTRLSDRAKAGSGQIGVAGSKGPTRKGLREFQQKVVIFKKLATRVKTKWPKSG